jgi:lysophospholipase L1-like esterase
MMPRWLFLGDSITVGMSESLGRSMLSLGQESDIVAAVSLDVEGALVNRQFLGYLAKRPRAVVVALGTNPYGIGEAERFRSGIADLMRKIWTVTDVVGWISPWAGPAHDQRQMDIRAWVPVRWADGLILGRGLERVGEDDVHFSTRAYEELGRRVAEWSVRVVDPRVLTVPGNAGKVVSVLGLMTASSIPVAPEIGRMLR